MNVGVRRLEIGPINRVEGDVSVQLDIAEGVVREARVKAPLFRGFELMLKGRDARDALVLTPRICGICSVAQSMAAAEALRSAMGLRMSTNGRYVANLLLACENVADHLSHFYLFFMPDLARGAYAGRPWHAAMCERFNAQAGSAAADFLPVRAQWMHITGLLAGKWPHTLAIQPGGSTRPLKRPELMRLERLIVVFREFLEKVLFADSLENVGSIDSLDALLHWARAHEQADFARFVLVAEELGMAGVGGAQAAFMSFGAYPQPLPDGVVDADVSTNADDAGDAGTVPPAFLFCRGVVDAGVREKLDTSTIMEDASAAWMQANASQHPLHGDTTPLADMEQKPDAYTWCKAPRLRGRVAEVGALARQVVAGHPLALDLLRHNGGRGSVLARVVMRLLEVALILPAMQRWVRAIEPEQPFCAHGKMPAQAQGEGLVEAARGSLGHWLVVRDGKVARYQIIAPTTWNFSPRDGNGLPGALEQALVGVHVDADAPASTPMLQHIIRSFDPCMVCTVH